MNKNEGKARSNGYFRVLTVGATPVYVRWTAVMYIGLSVYLLLQGKRAIPAAIAAWLALLVLHEVSHAIAARSFGARVSGIFIHLYGGRCLFFLPPKLWQIAVVLGAGVVAQFVILVPTLIWLGLYGVPKDPVAASVLTVLSAGNAILITMVLVPWTHRSGMMSDGLRLWQLYRHAYHGAPHPFLPPIVPPDQSPVFDPAVSLLSRPELVPEGFVTGIAIYNDAKTPMDFVFQALASHLGFEEDAAIRLMLDIHNRGGGLVPLPSRERAEEIAAAIMADARHAGHPFTCCAVEVGGQPGRMR